ncbi:MAG TPA: phosphoribosylformylglycinamidine synthase subunit PurQ [Longimicrobiales bacterium]|nr:phosphoribosylformylglycinamidine synthase subunit PurQ [Longimicrobiales bacterium]
MNAAIITFPGSNCDYDCYKAITDVLGRSARFVWHRETGLGETDLVILPGGFSYGDYLRAGAIARFSPIMDAVQRFAADGGIVLGICNGFQVLCEAGMLPGALIRNESLKFLGRTVHVRVENADTAFSNAYETGQVLEMHIAHGDGNYVADEDTLDMLESTGRVVFRYVTGSGLVTAAANPNGSMRSIAGIINEGGNVLGLMPHPERSVEALLGSADGLGVFASLDAHLSGEAVQATAGER